MNTTTERVVIVGAGQSGAECAAALRMAKYPGEVVIIGEETHLPYSRPPLSKAYLLGESSVDELALRPAAFYEKQHIQTMLGRRVVSVDRDAQEVVLDGGDRVGYTSLVLATGGRARTLPDPVALAAPNVHALRTIADVEAIRADFVPGSRLVIIGGGYVGLEVASAARKLGLSVTVLEAAPRLLARVAGPEVSQFFFRVHTEEGVDVRLDCMAAGFDVDDSGRVTAVRLSDGTTVPTDAVLVGVGLVPNDDLARAAGLEVDDGVVVDELCTTSDAHIYAIGDVSRHPCSEHGGMRRLESVPNATEQGRLVASVIVGGPQTKVGVPWFWSEQYDFKLQSVGLASTCDQVVLRGDTEQGRSFAAFYLKDGLVRAAEVVGSARDFAAAKKLVAARARVEPTQLADLSTPLKDLVRVPA